MELVRWLQDLAQDDLPLAGGKGANLGEMVRAGLPVPPGFVVLTPAYWRFVAANGLEEAVAPPPGARAESAAALQECFLTGRVPPEVVEAVRRAYRELGGGPVAVRSSATAEDLPEASFAGQQESYLNMVGPEAVVAAVQRCWASLWTPRAVSYRSRQGVTEQEVALAVVVQKMVPAAAAGVLFTANPLNGRRDQMVISAAWGLGEAVVGGQVNPDQWVVAADTGAVLEARIARKEVRVEPAGEGTRLVPVPSTAQKHPTLAAADLSRLVELGRQAAAHFGSPQDVEWALAEGQLYLVQSRPITTLFPLPAPPPGPEEPGLRVYACANIAQGVPEPFTPMGRAVYREMVAGLGAMGGAPVRVGSAEPLVKVAAGRIFIDVTEALQHPRLRPKLAMNLGRVEPGTLAILEHLMEREPELAPWRRGWAMNISFGYALRILGQTLVALAAPDGPRRRALAQVEARLQSLQRQAEEQRTVEERRRFVVQAVRQMRWLLEPLLPVTAVGWLAEPLAEAALKRWLADAGGLRRVIRSLPHNPTTEMDLALWDLARTLAAAGEEPTPDHPAVRDFLARYGHRALREIDVGVPRWREDPTYVLEMVRIYQQPGATDAAAHFRQGAAAAGAAAADLVAQVRRKSGPLRAAVLRFLLRRLRATGGLREAPKFYAVRLLDLLHRVLLEAGEEMAKAGRLHQAADVFWLELTELASDPASSSPLPSRVRERQAEYQRELGRRRVPRVLTSTGETFYDPPQPNAGAAAADSHRLTGTPASPGVYEGRVRVVTDPAGARLEPGEVLVAPATDPAWTPLFLQAGALVMETGGAMSHGTVVAREYGIPAVVGVVGAIHRLRTGQRVRVDGAAGSVDLL